MSKTIYITTPLYYVNAAPHIGHSYTEIAADCLARYHRLKGEEVFFLTGTDEHGQKIEQAATAAGKTPPVFVDEVVERFKDLWKLLSISDHDFIRTTQERHVRVVQTCLTRLHHEGKLHHATYQGWYCTPCETFWTTAELLGPEEAGGVEIMPPPCLSCRRPLEEVKEEGWHLPLGEHREWLKKFLIDNPTFIRPETRYNEILSLLGQPLPASLCITRPKRRVAWGIDVPFSPQHVVYVWFDALLNYISAVGYGVDERRFAEYWPADVHFIGKDILRHHAIYWPIILHALGLLDDQMPKMIFAHGWWKMGEQKMSKSLGNIVDPTVVINHVLKGQPFAADVYRYFLLREVPFGQDGSFSEEGILSRLSADLANDLGNLVNRTLSMIERYCGGKIPEPHAVGCAVDDEPLRQAAVGLAAQVEEAMMRLEFSTALALIMRVVTQANRYIEVVGPWRLAKQPEQVPRLRTALSLLAEVMRVMAVLLEPFMPSVAQAMWQQLGCGSLPRRVQDAARWPQLPAGQSIGPHPVLFPQAGAEASG